MHECYGKGGIGLCYWEGRVTVSSFGIDDTLQHFNVLHYVCLLSVKVRRAHRIYQWEGHNFEVGPPGPWAPRYPLPKTENSSENSSEGPLFFGWAHLFFNFPFYFSNLLLCMGKSHGPQRPLVCVQLHHWCQLPTHKSGCW